MYNKKRIAGQNGDPLQKEDFMDFSQMKLLAASRTTPAPSGGNQVVSEVKDAVGVAKDLASSFREQLPVLLFHLVMAVVVILAGILIVRLGKMIISRLIRRRSKKKGISTRTDTIRSIVSSLFGYVMYFLIVAIVLSIFGVDLGSILAAAGVVGIAIGFGAQTLVKDIISGLFIWGEGNLAVGDLVSINDLTGTVESISIRTTVMRNYNGNLYTIPNGDIRTVTNMSRGFRRAIVQVPCPYEENQERIVEMLRDEMKTAAAEIEGLKDIPDVMSIVSFEKHAVMVQVAVACPIGEHWRVERDLRSRIKARFDREGIMMPHFVLPDSENK